MELLGYWHVGVWTGRNSTDYEVYLDGDILKLKKTSDIRWLSQLPLKREIGARYFGDSEFLVGLDPEFVTRLLVSFDGKTEQEIKAIAEKYIEKREEAYTQRLKDLKRWEVLRKKFGGTVIGLDKNVDVYESGFSIRVLFDTALSFTERREFVRNNQRDFLLWVMNEIPETRCVMRKIGDIRYYKPVEIVVLRAAEAEVKFETRVG